MVVLTVLVKLSMEAREAVWGKRGGVALENMDLGIGGGLVGTEGGEVGCGTADTGENCFWGGKGELPDELEAQAAVRANDHVGGHCTRGGTIWVGRRCTKEDRVAETVELENQRFVAGERTMRFWNKGIHSPQSFFNSSLGRLLPRRRCKHNWRMELQILYEAIEAVVNKTPTPRAGTGVAQQGLRRHRGP